MIFSVLCRLQCLMQKCCKWYQFIWKFIQACMYSVDAFINRKTKKKSEYSTSDEPQVYEPYDGRRGSIRPTPVSFSNEYSETPNNENTNIANNNTTSGAYTYVTIPNKESNSVSDRGNDDTILKDNSLYASGIRDIALVNQEKDGTLLVENSLYCKELNVSAPINYDTILMDNSLYVRKWYNHISMNVSKESQQGSDRVW